MENKIYCGLTEIGGENQKKTRSFQKFRLWSFNININS